MLHLLSLVLGNLHLNLLECHGVALDATVLDLSDVGAGCCLSRSVPVFHSLSDFVADRCLSLFYKTTPVLAFLVSVNLMLASVVILF